MKVDTAGKGQSYAEMLAAKGGDSAREVTRPIFTS